MTSCVIGRAPAKAGAQDHTRRARNSGFLLSQEHERASLSLPRQLAADDHAHHLVGAFEDRMDAQITPEALDRVIHQIAVAAVKLERAIDRKSTRMKSSH